MTGTTAASSPLKKAETMIRMAWGAAILSGVLTLGVTLYAMSTPGFLGFDKWGLLDVGLIFALGYGIYRRSRICAVAMLAYFIASKLLLASKLGPEVFGPVAIVFFGFYLMGVIGTFRWHALNRTAAMPLVGGA